MAITIMACNTKQSEVKTSRFEIDSLRIVLDSLHASQVYANSYLIAAKYGLDLKIVYDIVDYYNRAVNRKRISEYLSKNSNAESQNIINFYRDEERRYRYLLRNTTNALDSIEIIFGVKRNIAAAILIDYRSLAISNED
jgi:hypothetical protein